MEKAARGRAEKKQRSRTVSAGSESVVLWYDSRNLETPEAADSIFSRLRYTRYTAALLYLRNIDLLSAMMSKRMQRVVHLDTLSDLEVFLAHPLFSEAKTEGFATLVISSSDVKVLAAARERGLPTCFRACVADAASLHEAIETGKQHAFLMLGFRDPTNIPLELVIASLQPTQTVLIKEVIDPDDVEDAVVSLGVMEVGADGVMFSPLSHHVLDRFLSRLDSIETPHLRIEVGRVTRVEPVGMGYRSCVDLATLFSPTEGLLVGSTSHGGILCCAEVFFLPYMELRPFRVNAGAVHSYIYNCGKRTNYLTELRAGSPVMVVDTKGKPRRAYVGRIKTEIRPLRLIEAEFGNGTKVNVLMQDDWHVRIFSDKSRPLNITELKPGDRVLGHVTVPGRHVGIKVDEHIIET